MNTTDHHCPNCGAALDSDECQFGVGPQSIRFDWTCPGCGWLVRVEAKTLEFVIAQMEHQ